MRGKLNTKVLLLVIVIMLIPLSIMNGYQKFKSNMIADEPIDGIQCEFVGEISPLQRLTRSMLKVQAFTTSGLAYVTNNYEVDIAEAPEHGSSFDVTITYKDTEQKITIPIKRNKTVEYSIGYPIQEDVKATLYSNGDLEFTGKGNTLTFSKGNMPWEREEYKYVTFGNNVMPENIDYWFQGNRDLIKCGKLPKTIKSMIEAFSGDTNLQECPELFQCTQLLVMKGAFSNCTSLKKTDTLPVSVVNAESAFAGCTNLIESPDLSKANNLANINKICSGCVNMVSVPAIPDSVIEMSGAFENCTNVHEAAPFPPNVEVISSAYANDTSLETGASIPESVKQYSQCYSNCRNLNGILEINTDSSNYSGLFNNAVSSGLKLSLIGNSGRLIDIQQSSGNRSIILGDPDEASRQSLRLEAELEAAR